MPVKNQVGKRKKVSDEETLEENEDAFKEPERSPGKVEDAQRKLMRRRSSEILPTLTK
jgi:hypothetical protein